MSSGKFDLEERTFVYARDVAMYCMTLPREGTPREFIDQLIKSSSSVGSNYIEANEALGKKDFRMHIRISRKEAKESQYWLRLMKETNPALPEEPLNRFIQEAIEFRKILTAILDKSA